MHYYPILLRAKLKQNEKTKTQKLVLAAMMAALVCISTFLIKIPSPLHGYLHPGDCFVLMAGWILSPLYGFLAAGLGSGLADLLGGYAVYAPATFLIKGLVALCACILYRALSAGGKHPLLPRLFSSLAAETVMVLGYFAWAALLFGEGLAAAASIPGNIVQGIVAVILSGILMALYAKKETDLGTKVGTSLFASGIWCNAIGVV